MLLSLVQYYPILMHFSTAMLVPYIGANNLFDEFPNEVETRLANGLPYSRRTPFGYDGGMWYFRGTVNF